MIKVSNYSYTLMGTAFVLLSIIGYPLAVTLFLPQISEVYLTQTVTYPYRAIVLLLAILIIITSPTEKVNVRTPRIAIAYSIFMLIYFTRILFDIYVRNIYIMPGYKTVIVQYIFLSLIPSLWASMRCALYIDYNKLNKYLVFAALLLLALLFYNQSSLFAIEYNEMERANAGAALNTIGLGHAALSIIIIVFFSINQKKTFSHLFKYFYLIAIFLAFVVLLRAASRGPLISLVLLFFFYIFSSTKYKFIGICLSIITFTFIYLNLISIVRFLSSISPVMGQRLAASIYEEDSSGRNELLENAFDLIEKNPIFGEQFITDFGIYSHNSIVDVTMALGVLGGLVFVFIIYKLFRISYNSLQNNSVITIICILALQFFLKGCFSGAMYTDNSMCVCISLVLVTYGTLVNKTI